ncbi:hypothetical protein [Clostridium sp. JN-1]|uniref:hypothetical protein n=1 Tax=Clostridium sp. JN-1 TaxID=2483110 RepID=UPI0016808855|nr:hypothetical protein [Clostridium sp. JN-1]
MILVSCLFLITIIIILVMVIGLKRTSKSCDFEINFSIKGLKVKFTTKEKSSPSSKK